MVMQRRGLLKVRIATLATSLPWVIANYKPATMGLPEHFATAATLATLFEEFSYVSTIITYYFILNGWQGWQEALEAPNSLGYSLPPPVARTWQGWQAPRMGCCAI